MGGALVLLSFYHLTRINFHTNALHRAASHQNHGYHLSYKTIASKTNGGESNICFMFADRTGGSVSVFAEALKLLKHALACLFT